MVDCVKVCRDVLLRKVGCEWCGEIVKEEAHSVYACTSVKISMMCNGNSVQLLYYLLSCRVVYRAALKKIVALISRFEVQIRIRALATKR